MIFVAFLIPLAVYFFVLALIHRARQPVLVAGVWDCAGMLAAASGFILVGGPAILTGLYEQWRMSWLVGRPSYLRELDIGWHFWISLWGLYFLLVCVGAALLVRQQRGRTSIYNIDPTGFDQVLAMAVEKLGLETHTLEPNRLRIRSRQSEAGVLVAESWVDLSWQSSPVMRHISLQWSGEYESVRCHVERTLEPLLHRLTPLRNPVSSWFLSISTSMFLFCFVVVVVLVLLRILRLVH